MKWGISRVCGVERAKNERHLEGATVLGSNSREANLEMLKFALILCKTRQLLDMGWWSGLRLERLEIHKSKPLSPFGWACSPSTFFLPKSWLKYLYFMLTNNS